MENDPIPDTVKQELFGVLLQAEYDGTHAYGLPWLEAFRL